MKHELRRRRVTRAGLAHTAPIFAALGDETRLGLVVRLGSAGPLSIVQLAEGTEVTRQAITKHLTVLEDAGVVKSERRGRERIWEVQVAQLGEASQFIQSMTALWDDRLSRLKAFVEKDA